MKNSVATIHKDLIEKLDKAQVYVLNRYNFYNDEPYEKNNSDAIKITIDDIRNKLIVSHFINAKRVESYFTKNFLNKVIKSCLISGCAFARIIKHYNGSIDLIPIDAYYATGKLMHDNTLSEAITIDKVDDKGNPSQITFYSTNKIIVTYPGQGKEDKVIDNISGVIPLIPLIVNQNTFNPFGNSSITKKMISETKILRKTKNRADKVQDTLTEANTFLLGVSQDLENELDQKTLDLLKNVITITKDADGTSPSVMTRENGVSQLEQKIKDLENSIKYDTTTPQYADMIESIRQDLIDSINLIGDAIIKIVNNDQNAKLNGKIDIVFKNNEFTDFSAFMDGVLKVNQVVPGYLGYQQLDKILGIQGNKPKLVEAIKDDIKSQIDVDELTGVKTGSQKMYSTKSVVKDYRNKKISEALAVKSLQLVDWSESEAIDIIAAENELINQEAVG